MSFLSYLFVCILVFLQISLAFFYTLWYIFLNALKNEAFWPTILDCNDNLKNKVYHRYHCDSILLFNPSKMLKTINLCLRISLQILVIVKCFQLTLILYVLIKF